MPLPESLESITESEISAPPLFAPAIPTNCGKVSTVILLPLIIIGLSHIKQSSEEVIGSIFVYIAELVSDLA